VVSQLALLYFLAQWWMMVTGWWASSSSTAPPLHPAGPLSSSPSSLSAGCGAFGSRQGWEGGGGWDGRLERWIPFTRDSVGNGGNGRPRYFAVLILGSRCRRFYVKNYLEEPKSQFLTGTGVDRLNPGTFACEGGTSWPQRRCVRASS
jgi:hypothetical protein